MHRPTTRQETKGVERVEKPQNFPKSEGVSNSVCSILGYEDVRLRCLRSSKSVTVNSSVC